MCRLTNPAGRIWKQFGCTLLLLCACSGCPQPSEPFEKKIPLRWIRITTADESKADAALDSADVERLKATVPTITQIVTERHASAVLHYDGRTHEINLATGPDMLRLLSDVPGTMVSNGRFLTGEDIRRPASVVVLTHSVAEALFAGASPVGKEVTIDGDKLVVVGTVIGVERMETRFSLHGAYVPTTFATSDSATASNETTSATDARLDCIWVSVDKLEDVNATREIIASLLKRHNKEVKFRID